MRDIERNVNRIARLQNDIKVINDTIKICTDMKNDYNKQSVKRSEIDEKNKELDRLIALDLTTIKYKENIIEQLKQ